MKDGAEFYQSASGPIVIVGNGPSLEDIPDEFLNKYPTFGCNAIHLRRGFKPTYYAISDNVVPGLWEIACYEFPGVPKFLRDGMRDMKPEDWERDDVYVWHRRNAPIWIDQRKYGPHYLKDPGIATKGTVTAMLQVADWMGYDKFFLVGCDNTGDGKHFYGDTLYGAHAFDPPTFEWGFSILQVCLIPKVIFNLSTRGEIKCLPRADWRKL